MVNGEKRKRNREYYLKHREEQLKQSKARYREKHEEIRAKSRLRYLRDREKILLRRHSHYAEYRQRILASIHALKLRALQTVSGLDKPRCNNCGCDDMNFLEINHKQGGGNREHKKLHSTNMYQAIVYGRRTANGKIYREVDDLEILCRVCNSAHYLRLKFPNAQIYPEVVWKRMSEVPLGKDIVGSCSTETLAKLKESHRSGFFLLISQDGCDDCKTMRDVLAETVKDKKPVIEAPVEDEECNRLAKDLLKDQPKIVTPSILYYEMDSEPRKIVPDGVKTWDSMRKELRELADRSPG